MARIIASVGFAGVILGLLLIVGWVGNICKLANHASDPITTITVLRAVGIFVAPLGGILGWF